MLLPPYFPVGMVLFGLKTSPFLHQMKESSLWPNNSSLISSGHRHFCQKSSGFSRCALANFRWALRCLICRRGVFLRRHARRPPLRTVLTTVDLVTVTQELADSLTMLFAVVLRSLLTSLTIFFSSLGVIFLFLPCPFLFLMILNFLYFTMMALTVDLGAKNHLAIWS